MKRISIFTTSFLGILGSIVFLSQAVFAQSEVVLMRPQLEPVTEVQGAKVLPESVTSEQDQQVYVTDIKLQKNSFNAGEEMRFNFNLYNATPFDINALYYKVVVADAKKPNRALSYQVVGPISMHAGQTIQVPSSMRAPKATLSDKMILRIVPTIETGITYPFKESAEFTVANAKRAYDAGSWALITNDNQIYPFQAGPSLYKNATPTSALIDVWLKPNSPSVEQLSYRLQVYKRAVGFGEPVFTTTSELLEVLPANSEDEGGLDVQIPLPTLDYTPGVYEAYIEFVDQEGIVRAPLILARYIVQGSIASIQFVRTDLDQVKKGETFKLISSITGAPTDIFTTNRNESNKNAELNILVKNEKNQVVADEQKTIVLVEDMFEEIAVEAKVAAKAMYVEAKIVQDGVVLAEWQSPVSPDYTNLAITHSKNNTILMTVLGLIVLLIVILLLRKIKKPKTPMPTIATIFIFGILIGIPTILVSPDIADANTVGAPTVQVTFPAEGQVLLPGQKFIPRASVYYKACANWGYEVNLQFLNNNTPLQSSPFVVSQANRSTASCTGGTRKGKSCTVIGKNSSQCPTSDGGETRCAFDSHEIVGPNNEEYSSTVEATAPMTPGTYTVRAIAQGTGLVSDDQGIIAQTGSDENRYVVKDPNLNNTDNTVPGPNTGNNPGSTPTGGGGGGGCPAPQVFCPITNTCIAPDQPCTQVCGAVFIAENQGLPPTGLCQSGATLLPGSIFSSLKENRFSWSCQRAGEVSVRCDTSCPTGSSIDQTTNTCRKSTLDWCPNIEGNQALLTGYTRDESGQCQAIGEISYFRFNPSTSRTQCPAFWETKVSEGIYAECAIGTRSVTPNHPMTSPANQLFDVGRRYTLSCEFKNQTDDSLIGRSSLTAVCTRAPEVVEN